MHNPRLQWMNYLTNRWTSRSREKKFAREPKNKFSKNQLSTDDNWWINRRNIWYIAFIREESMNRGFYWTTTCFFFICPPVIRGYRIWLFPLRDYRSCGLSRLRNCIRMAIRWDDRTTWKEANIIRIKFIKIVQNFFLFL